MGGEVVVLDLKSSTYLSVNDSGSAIWRRLQEPASRDQLIDAVVEQFDVERNIAEADVDSFLDTLESRGLIETIA